METRIPLNSTLNQENQKRAIESKIPTTGSTIKRKKLSDITNLLIPSSLNPKIEENLKEGNCVITKECIQQLMEENASLLKALGEKNKIVELSSIELQKFRVTVERYNQQIRGLAQANSQLLAEITFFKQRNKTLQHELGCTTAVLKVKNSELDEKKRLIKELSGKIRVVEERLSNKQCEETKAEEAGQPTYAEVANSDMAYISNRKRPCRSKTLGSNTLIIQAKEKTTNEQYKQIRAKKERSQKELCEMNTAEEDQSKFAQVESITMSSHPTDDNMAHKPKNKRMLRSQSLGATATTSHQADAKEIDATGKSSRRRTSNLTSEAHKSIDCIHETIGVEIPACSVVSEPLNDTESVGKHDTRKSSRKKSNSLKSVPQESEVIFCETSDANVPTCLPITKPLDDDNPSNANSSMKHEDGNTQNDQSSSSSQCEAQVVVRTSVGRPTRKAAEKISSYKEIPINVKMRRG